MQSNSTVSVITALKLPAPLDTQVPGLDIRIEGELPITTGARLNEFIDRGYRFYGTLLVGGERIRIVAFRGHAYDDVSSVVIVGAQRSHIFADVVTSSISPHSTI